MGRVYLRTHLDTVRGKRICIEEPNLSTLNVPHNPEPIQWLRFAADHPVGGLCGRDSGCAINRHLHADARNLARREPWANNRPARSISYRGWYAYALKWEARGKACDPAPFPFDLLAGGASGHSRNLCCRQNRREDGEGNATCQRLAGRRQ